MSLRSRLALLILGLASVPLLMASTHPDDAERVKAFRERQRQEAKCNAGETPCNAIETPETPREEKSREEITLAKASVEEPR